MSNTIQVQWVKKGVSKTEMKYYSEHPTYYLLRKHDKGAQFAFRQALDGPLDHHLELCTPEEITRLEHKRQVGQQHQDKATRKVQEIFNDND